MLIQNTYTFVGKYLKVIEVFTKNWTLIFDIAKTLKEKICFLKIRAQFVLGQGSGPAAPQPPIWLHPCIMFFWI